MNSPAGYLQEEGKVMSIKKAPVIETSGLYPWQEYVIDQIESYEDDIGSESMQTLDDYTQNRNSMIQVSLRRGAGHTFLTAHLAKRFAATIVYLDLDHFREMELCIDSSGGDKFHEDSKFVSIYEMIKI